MWRVIGLESRNAYENMALDESISAGIADGGSDPTVRFYAWKPSAVSIGCFQSMGDEVNVAMCRKLGIDCIRRKTGGGAVYHDEHGELTYSVIAPESMLPAGIRESYAEICGWVIRGLRQIGIEAAFAPINDIVVGARKISGSAQTRRRGVLLQHGTILYTLDAGRMFSVLNVSKEKISDKAIKNVEERVTCVSDHAEVSMDALYKAMLDGFTFGKEFEFGDFTRGEKDMAEGLVDEYMSDAWNFSR